MRPIRRSKQTITDASEIERIVQRAQICRLGLIDQGEPYVVPLCYGYEGKRVYIHAAKEGRKLEAIRANPRVCVEIEGECQVVPAEDACGWAMCYESVIGWGAASILEDPDQVIAALDVIMAHYGGPPVDPTAKALGRTAIICVEIQAWSGKRSK